MQAILKRLLPFIFLGMLIVLLAFGFVLFAYLFLIGSLVGLVLFIIQWIRQQFIQKPEHLHNQKKQTRIIDLNDWKRH